MLEAGADGRTTMDGPCASAARPANGKPSPDDLPLYEPDSVAIERSNITAFLGWLGETRGLFLSGYHALHEWSIKERDAFWSALWEYFRIEADTPYQSVTRAAPDDLVRWFEGAHLNFAQHMLREEAECAQRPAFKCYSESGGSRTWLWQDVGEAVRGVATGLRALGIGPGDRVAAYMPNLAETAIAMLAVTAVGAIWSCCGMEYGVNAVVDRFAQIEPKLLLAADGYRFGGADYDRRDETALIVGQLPSLEHVIIVPNLFKPFVPALPPVAGIRVHGWEALLAKPAPPREAFRFESMASNAPLWILFTSGTTGIPKAVMHSHGGMLLGLHKDLYFHAEIDHAQTMFYHSSTSWVIWNIMLASMMFGACVVLYDGSPVHPHPGRLWEIAADSRATRFGTSPPLVERMMATGCDPAALGDLSALALVVLGGSAAGAAVYHWLASKLGKDVRIGSQAGSTELCGTYAGSAMTLPCYAGEIQARALGMDVVALDDGGNALRDEVGELIIKSAFPNMPIGFWNDPEGQRFRETYFPAIPGMWWQGDQILVNARGGCHVSGRSDATIKRNGVRIGTAEIYRALVSVTSIVDAIAVYPHCGPYAGRLLLFVVPKRGVVLDRGLRDRIGAALTARASPRHVPDDIFLAPAIPYTMTGKRMEVPLRRLMEGASAESVFRADLMHNPAAAPWFIAFSGENARAAMS